MTTQALAATSTDLPRRGHLLPDFGLRSTDGKEVRISDYRSRGNLVVIAAGRCDDRAVLSVIQELARRSFEVLEEEASVILVVHGSPNSALLLRQRHRLHFVVLADEDGQVHRLLGAVDEVGGLRPAVYITDRFGEIFAVFRTADGDQLPEGSEILSWLEFVNRQCPECFPPEWPAL